ncbi:MAG: DUF116 domain-containing protein [Parachlamydiales bacterium]|nr:DUF116 domain-containing protein [Parachlamydiales bacterium]
MSQRLFFSRLRALWYLSRQDKQHILLSYFLKHPFKHGKNLLLSLIKKNPYRNKGDPYYFGLRDDQDWTFTKNSNNTHLLVGFPYCMRPLDCPAKRFSSQCLCRSSFPCNTCLIKHSRQNSNAEILIIPTLYEIAKKIVLFRKQYPHKELLFLIISCPMTIHFCADLANMIELKGVALPLEGDLCKNFLTFLSAEKGIKKKQTSFNQELISRFLR